MAIDLWFVNHRLGQLGITDAVLAHVADMGIDLAGEVNEWQVSVAALERLAQLLRVRVADLLTDALNGTDAAHADMLLLEFAMAATMGDMVACVELLGWSQSRLSTAMRSVAMGSASHGMGVADAVGGGENHGGEHESSPNEFLAWFAAHSAPDPFDAAAMLRVVHARSAAPPAYTVEQEAQRLAKRRLAVLADPGPDPAPFGESGYDAAIAPHPDLLFALDLAGPPAERSECLSQNTGTGV